MNNNFAHLHIHTEYSALDGFGSAKAYAERAKELDQKYIAITDHGNMFGAIRFYKKAMEKGIKPILGCEMYIAPESRFDRTTNRAMFGKKPYYHLTVLVENYQGYKNLIKLVSAGYLEGFYYRPRIDRELLSSLSEGLIALSGCLGGEMPMLLSIGQQERAYQVAKEYQQIFGDGKFFLELQDHQIPEQRVINPLLLEMSQKMGIPTVATNDCHFLTKDDYFAHDVLMAIQTQTTVKDRGRLRYTKEHYFKSPEEMKEVFKWIPEAIENTQRIAEKCNFMLNQTGYHLPEFKVPKGYTVEEYFREVVDQGFRERLEKLKERKAQGKLGNTLEEYQKRLDDEIKMLW